MKKFLKISSWFILIIIVLVIVLIVTAKLAENKITGIALKKVSEEIEAPVVVENVSFNLLRKFPLATIELYNVQLGAHKLQDDSLLTSLDTIIHINKIYVSVKSRPLINGDIEIMKVDIDGANVNYLVDTSGISNIDFLITSSDTTDKNDTIPSKPLNLNLTDLSVKNLRCNYDDKHLKVSAQVRIPELKIKAKLKGENITASAKGGITFVNCDFAQTNLYLMNKTNVDFDVDYINDSLSIKQSVVNTDGANLKITGNVLLGDNIKTDIICEGSDLILDELIKYAPKEMLEEFGLKKVAGIVNMHTKVKGIVSETDLPQVDVDINLKEGNIMTSDYPELKNISFSGKITNGILHNNKSTQADFSSFHFETQQSKFDVVFSLLDIDHPKYVIKTDMDVNVGEFRNFIPDSLLKSIDGRIKANISTKGELPDSIGNDFVDYIMANSFADIKFKDLDIKAYSTLSVQDFSSELSYKPNNLEIENLNISIPDYKVNLKNTSFDVDFKGSINNLDKMALNLKSYHIETGHSEFSGAAKVRSLNYPDYRFTSNIKLNLDEVKSFVPDTLVTKLSGTLLAKIESSGKLNLDSITEQAMDIVFKTSTFNLDFRNVSIELPDDSLYKIENFSGLIDMSTDTIKIYKMSGVSAGVDFEIDSTKIENLYNSVIKNQPGQLVVDTRLSLGDIDYAMFAPFMMSDTTKEDTEAEDSVNEKTNYTMLLKGVAKVKSFTYDKVFIKDISTLFNVTDSLYIIDKFKFNAFSGNMNSSIRYTIKPGNKSVVETHHIIEKMDVNKLLADFDNFEAYYEPAIKSENLSGLLSTDLYSRIVMIGDSIIQPDMRVLGTLKLEDGGVYEFEPATNMSKFTGIDELDNIKFKTLDSKIFIFKSAIYVPETFISSTALNIAAYGMQSFGEDYEYHLKIKLSDILFGKSKKQKRRESKAGENFEDERNMREIVSYSIDGKNKNGFDNESLQRKMKNKIVMQEKMLNFRFDPRLVNFDTNVYPKKKK